ncbi:MAG: PQQ-binding-like beta-propeller repeat protein [bacterium]
MNSVVAILALSLVALYRPEQWQHFPAMTEIRSIAVSPGNVYVAVPGGVYVLDARTLEHTRALVPADGLGEDVLVCAWNAARSELLVACETGLFSYLPQTDLMQKLAPPFSRVTSIGVSRSGAYLSTDRGLFRKHLTLDQFEPVESVPGQVFWHGELDTSSPLDHVFLTPYFFADEQLFNHPLGVVSRDSRRRRLLVAARGYGLLQYHLRTGMLERRIRLGPFGTVRRVARTDGQLWLTGSSHITLVDSAGSWSSYLLAPGLPLPTGLRVRLTELVGSLRGINDFISESGQTLLATDRGLFSALATGAALPVLTTSRPLLSLLRIGDTLLLGTDNGLYVPDHDSLVRVTEPTGRTDWGVYGMARAGNGSLWFATLGGLVTRDSLGTWQRLSPPGVNPSAPVRAIATDDQRLFFGFDGGVGAYDLRTGGWTFWDSSTGVPGGAITALYADSGRLWIATPGMVSIFDYGRELPGPRR